MRTRVAVISIIVENPGSIEKLNQLLFENRDYIIGRMGIPYREKNVNLISIAIDAPEDVINALTGKLGRLDGVGAKTNYSNVITEDGSAPSSASLKVIFSATILKEEPDF